METPYARRKFKIPSSEIALDFIICALFWMDICQLKIKKCEFLITPWSLLLFLIACLLAF